MIKQVLCRVGEITGTGDGIRHSGFLKKTA